MFGRPCTVFTLSEDTRHLEKTNAVEYIAPVQVDMGSTKAPEIIVVVVDYLPRVSCFHLSVLNDVVSPVPAGRSDRYSGNQDIWPDKASCQHRRRRRYPISKSHLETILVVDAARDSVSSI